MGVLNCLACNAELMQNARFCPQCGAAAQQKCPGCGEPAEPAARFCAKCGSSLQESQLGARAGLSPRKSRAPRSQRRGSEAERRHLTVVFLDLESSTELAQRIDEEDLRKLVESYYDLCERVIKRYDGHIANYIGDGVLVYFGYPAAHEDDAERAIRASLEILNELKTLSYPSSDSSTKSMSGRVGIHTGAVIVGDLGEGSNRAGTALGETMNLAARLEEIAESNTVVISAQTHKLVRGIFVEKDLGVQKLKGIREAVHTYRVIQGSGVRGKLETTTRQLSKFVGHELEIALLLDRWEKTEYGEGQVVMITGEAGMGKSRLAVVLRERLRETPHTWLECTCSQYTSNTAFHPILEVIHQGLAFTEGDTPESKFKLLVGALERVGIKGPEPVSLLASFLDLPLDDTYPPLEIGPDLQRRRTLDLLTNWLIGLGQIQPLIMVFEDLHWCDPSSLDLIGAILARNQTSRVLMVLTTRPNFTSPWGDRSHLTPIKVSNLNHRHSREIAAGLSPEYALPEAVLEMIVERSGGIPLYVEELTQMVLESGILEEKYGMYVLTGSLADLSIPATLQDSLMARLDRMADAKGIAQMASVLGREFTYIMLAEISQKAEKELEENLTTLVKAELLFQRGTSPDSTYTFKHALIQDAAYQSMLKSVRRQLHERAANSLEKRYSAETEAEPEVLARHLEAAGNIERAGKIYQQAGEQAQLRSAYKEKMSHYDKALTLLNLLPENTERDQWELELQIAAGQASYTVLGQGHEVTLKAYRRARDLADHWGDTGQKVVAYAGLSMATVSGEEPVEGELLAQKALKFAKEEKDVQSLLAAYRSITMANFFLGNLQATKEYSAEAQALSPESQSKQTIDFPGGNSFVAAYTYSALAHHGLGNIVDSLRFLDIAKEMGRESDEPATVCNTLMYGCGVNIEIGQIEQAKEDGLEAFDVAQKNALVSMVGVLQVFMLAIDDALGLIPNPAETIKGALTMLSFAAPKSATSILVSILVKPLLQARDFEGAKTALDNALDVCEVTGHGYAKEELLRLRGEVALQFADEGEAAAENYFEKSLELAQEREAKFWELRTGLSITRLRISQGRGEEGVALLRPVYEWFSDEFETGDMRDVKALLEEYDAEGSAQPV